MHCPLSRPRSRGKNVSDVMLPKLRPCFTLGITHAAIHITHAVCTRAINESSRSFTESAVPPPVTQPCHPAVSALPLQTSGRCSVCRVSSADQAVVSSLIITQSPLQYKTPVHQSHVYSSVRICSTINSITGVSSDLVLSAVCLTFNPESSLVLCLQARRCPGFLSKWPLVVVSKVTSCWSEYMNMSEYV